MLLDVVWKHLYKVNYNINKRAYMNIGFKMIMYMFKVLLVETLGKNS